MVKRCSCGREYSPASWSRLALLGQMDNGRGQGELLELRQCATCRSSMTVPLGYHAPSSTHIAVHVDDEDDNASSD